jgi:hypothetical protein
MTELQEVIAELEYLNSRLGLAPGAWVAVLVPEGDEQGDSNISVTT